MEKVKKAFGAAVSWFGVFWFVIFTIVSFPSFGIVIFLIGLTICLPIPATRNFWNEKGLHGASKIALIAALIVAGAVMSPHEATETPSDVAEIVEVQEKMTLRHKRKPKQRSYRITLLCLSQGKRADMADGEK